MLLILGLLSFALAGMVMPTESEEESAQPDTAEQSEQPQDDGFDLASVFADLEPRTELVEAEDDTLVGSDGDETLAGHGGDDVLSGEGGNDTLIGGMGDDQLFGGDGDDVLHGYYDNDTLVGGEGSDLLFGGNGDDILDGRETTATKDFLNGGSGDDWIIAGAGDHVNAGSGADHIAVFADAEGPAVIDDFDLHEDTLVIGYPEGDAIPTLETTADEGGLMVSAAGTPMVYLQGLQSIDLGRIQFEPIAA